MKSFLAISLLSLTINSYAETLLNSQTLKINSPDNLTKLDDLKISLSVSCKYKSGIFFPESKSCGNKTIELKAQNGILKIPSVEKFSGIRGSKADNYDVSLSFYEGDQYLTIVSAYGKEAIKYFNSLNNDEFNILRFEEATLGVSVLGADFFGSDLSKVDRASLSFRINAKKKDNTINEVMITNSLETSWWRENFSPYAGKTLLKDETKISLNSSSIGYFSKNAPEKLKINIYYSQFENYSHSVKLKNNLELELIPSALSDLKSIELK